MNPERSILFVDDEDDVRATFTAFFDAAGWKTFEASSADAAVTLAASERPDIVVLDVMMPGKTGHDVLRELRSDQRTSHIPVIMMTAVNDFDLGVHHDAETTGMFAGVRPPEMFLEKPVDTGLLLETVQRLLSLA